MHYTPFQGCFTLQQVLGPLTLSGSYVAARMGCMNEIDQLGVCCQQPCINNDGVAAAEHWCL